MQGLAVPRAEKASAEGIASDLLASPASWRRHALARQPVVHTCGQQAFEVAQFLCANHLVPPH